MVERSHFRVQEYEDGHRRLIYRIQRKFWPGVWFTLDRYGDVAGFGGLAAEFDSAEDAQNHIEVLIDDIKRCMRKKTKR